MDELQLLLDDRDIVRSSEKLLVPLDRDNVLLRLSSSVAEGVFRERLKDKEGSESDWVLLISSERDLEMVGRVPDEDQV